MSDIKKYYLTRPGIKDTSGIYAIHCNGSHRTYIGSSRNLSKRLHHHFKQLKTNQHGNKFMQRDFNKNPELFEYGIIENCGPEQLIEREKYWISYFQTTNNRCGYNSRIIPESNAGFKMPQYAKDKISLSMTGLKQSDEHKAKQCLARTGRKNNDSMKLQMSLLKLRVPPSTILDARDYYLKNKCTGPQIQRLFNLTRKQSEKVRTKNYTFLNA